jgi:hypothetical protein
MSKVSLANKRAKSISNTSTPRVETTNMSGALLTSPTTTLSLTMKVLSNQWMLAFKRQRLKIIQLLAFKTMVGAILAQLASHMTSMATQLNQIYAINNLAATGKT